ncbi:MAG: hypothetical protein ACLGSH_14310, partial [Acidobacteriota bacterium]
IAELKWNWLRVEREGRTGKHAKSDSTTNCKYTIHLRQDLVEPLPGTGQSHLDFESPAGAAWKGHGFSRAARWREKPTGLSRWGMILG